MPLNARQQRFVAEYCVDMNATQAAIRAGYSESRATVTGSELLANPEVQELVAVHLRKITERAEVTAEDIVREAWSIATGGKVEMARVAALQLLSKRHPEFSEKHEVAQVSTVLVRQTRTLGDGRSD